MIVSVTSEIKQTSCTAYLRGVRVSVSIVLAMGKKKRGKGGHKGKGRQQVARKQASRLDETVVKVKPANKSFPVPVSRNTTSHHNTCIRDTVVVVVYVYMCIVYMCSTPQTCDSLTGTYESWKYMFLQCSCAGEIDLTVI